MCHLTAVLRQGWEFIDVFTRVLASGHAEAKLKVKTLQQSLSEIVPFDHPEVFNWQISDGELNTAQAHRRTAKSSLFILSARIQICKYPNLRGANLAQPEKSRCELVTDKSASIRVNVPLVSCFV